MKKEDLIKENARLETELNKATKRDLYLREQFAAIFGWNNTTYGFSNRNEIDVRSWEQIFAKVGRLKERALRGTDHDMNIATVIDRLLPENSVQDQQPHLKEQSDE